jgi:CBS domain-containing protein
VEDEVANAMLWTGLMNGLPPDYSRMNQKMEFHEARSNFLKAARHGLDTRLEWMGRHYDARELLEKELIPIAREGLHKAGIEQTDLDKYLGIMQERVVQSKTGSGWILDSFNVLIKSYPQNTVLSAITRAILERQQDGKPVHQWEKITSDEIEDGPYLYRRVDQIMSKDLYTVYEEDLIDLVPNLMKWNQVRHMLVENRQGELVGLVTLGRLGKYYSENKNPKPVMVKEVMVNQVITVTPDTPTLEAIQLMQEKHVGCLPVLNYQKKLVGVVTEQDLLPVAASYLKADKDQ